MRGFLQNGLLLLVVLHTNTAMVSSRACGASHNTDQHLVSNPGVAGGIYVMSIKEMVG